MIPKSIILLPVLPKNSNGKIDRKQLAQLEMKKDLIIFGIGKIAEVIFYYAKEECGFNVVAFCVDEQYKNVESFQGFLLYHLKILNKIFLLLI